jgi:hypothetical protein
MSMTPWGLLADVAIDIIGNVASDAIGNAIANRVHRVRSSYDRSKSSKPTRPSPTPNGRVPYDSSRKDTLLSENRREAQELQNTSDNFARKYHSNIFQNHEEIIKKSPFLAQNHRKLLIAEERRMIDNKRYALDVERAKAENKRINLTHGDHPSRNEAQEHFNSKRKSNKDGGFSGLNLEASTMIGGALIGTALDVLSEFDFGDVELPEESLKVIEDFKQLISGFNGDKSIFRSAFSQLFSEAKS